MKRKDLNDMTRDELELRIVDLEQYIFKKKTEKEDTLNTDIAFLKELQTYCEKWDEKQDYMSTQMVFKMISDWIDDLNEQLAALDRSKEAE